jgi:hypothetical protein
MYGFILTSSSYLLLLSIKRIIRQLFVGLNEYWLYSDNIILAMYVIHERLSHSVTYTMSLYSDSSLYGTNESLRRT